MRAEVTQAARMARVARTAPATRGAGGARSTEASPGRGDGRRDEGARSGDMFPPDDAVLPGGAVLPVLPALRKLLPAGGLPRGSVVATGDWGLLGRARAAGAWAAGAWCAVAGLPYLGVAAAADAGLDLGRMLLIADPGPGWPQVVASLLHG